MLQRAASKILPYLSRSFPVIAITGPRQSGKTTLACSHFRDYEYFSLEDLDIRLEVQEDPRGFLRRRRSGFILDEVQHVPSLFSYLQTHVDASGKMGEVVISGSQNLLLMERLSQSLAGRVGLLE
ncbi:MAG: AAA family ATPase, partial [Coraliomargarita sp.]